MIWMAEILRFGALGLAAILAYFAVSVTRAAIRAPGGSKYLMRLVTVCFVFLLVLLIAGIVTERVNNHQREFIKESASALFDESSINMRAREEVPHCQNWLRRAALLLRQLGKDQEAQRAETFSRVNDTECETGINAMAPIIQKYR